jgi:hypothetical protein
MQGRGQLFPYTRQTGELKIKNFNLPNQKTEFRIRGERISESEKELSPGWRVRI